MAMLFFCDTSTRWWSSRGRKTSLWRDWRGTKRCLLKRALQTSPRPTPCRGQSSCILTLSWILLIAVSYLRRQINSGMSYFQSLSKRFSMIKVMIHKYMISTILLRSCRMFKIWGTRKLFRTRMQLWINCRNLCITWDLRLQRLLTRKRLKLIFLQKKKSWTH